MEIPFWGWKMDADFLKHDVQDLIILRRVILDLVSRRELLALQQPRFLEKTS
jgi:hypothetical protein